jgi:hypothetical protein
VCHRLGIKYLWIDSLCIIQGDEIDWAYESAKMGSIYSNSRLTIAADRARDDTEGCFNANMDHFAQVPISLPGCDVSTFYVRKPVMHLYLDQLAEDEKAKWPLVQRAWVYQEEVLSPRVVHYGPYEVTWRCREAIYCECERVKGTSASSYPFLTPETSFDNISTQWKKHVTMYSKRQLTYDKDRLPAIEGVARSLQRQAPLVVLGRYLAGLWSEGLLLDLLWFPRCKARYNRRPEKYRAPSWSWASIEGEVKFVELAASKACALVPEVEILDCQTVGAGEFGPFSHGWLKLRGRIVCRDLWMNMYGYDLGGPHDTEGTMSVRPDVTILPSDSTIQETIPQE